MDREKDANHTISSIIGIRSTLLQLVPSLTIPSMYVQVTAEAPLFVFGSLAHRMPPLLLGPSEAKKLAIRSELAQKSVQSENKTILKTFMSAELVLFNEDVTFSEDNFKGDKNKGKRTVIVDSIKQFLTSHMSESKVYKEWKSKSQSYKDWQRNRLTKRIEIDLEVEINPDLHDTDYKIEEGDKLYIKNSKRLLADKEVVIRFTVREHSDENCPRIPYSVKEHLEDCLHNSSSFEDKPSSKQEIEDLIRKNGGVVHSDLKHVRVKSATIIDDYQVEIENHEYYGIQEWHIQLLSLYYMMTYPRLFQFLLQALIVALAICILYSASISLNVLLVISAIIFICMAIGRSLTAVVFFGKLINFRDDDFISISKSIVKVERRLYNNLHKCNSIHSLHDLLYYTRKGLLYSTYEDIIIYIKKSSDNKKSLMSQKGFIKEFTKTTSIYDSHSKKYLYDSPKLSTAFLAIIIYLCRDDYEGHMNTGTQSKGGLEGLTKAYSTITTSSSSPPEKVLKYNEALVNKIHRVLTEETKELRVLLPTLHTGHISEESEEKLEEKLEEIELLAKHALHAIYSLVGDVDGDGDGESDKSKNDMKLMMIDCGTHIEIINLLLIYENATSRVKSSKGRSTSGYYIFYFGVRVICCFAADLTKHSLQDDVSSDSRKALTMSLEKIKFRGGVLQLSGADIPSVREYILGLLISASSGTLLSIILKLQEDDLKLQEDDLNLKVTHYYFELMALISEYISPHYTSLSDDLKKIVERISEQVVNRLVTMTNKNESIDKADMHEVEQVYGYGYKVLSHLMSTLTEDNRRKLLDVIEKHDVNKFPSGRKEKEVASVVIALLAVERRTPEAVDALKILHKLSFSTCQVDQSKINAAFVYLTSTMLPKLVSGLGLATFQQDSTTLEQLHYACSAARALVGLSSSGAGASITRLLDAGTIGSLPRILDLTQSGEALDLASLDLTQTDILVSCLLAMAATIRRGRELNLGLDYRYLTTTIFKLLNALSSVADSSLDLRSLQILVVSTLRVLVELSEISTQANQSIKETISTVCTVLQVPPVGKLYILIIFIKLHITNIL